MAGKFYVISISVLFLAAFIVTDITSSNPPIDLLKKLVNAVQELLSVLFDLLNKIDDGISNNFTECQKQMVEMTRNAFLKFVNRFKEPFDKIDERSTLGGQKLAKCIIDQGPGIVETAVILFDENSKCISGDLITVAKGLNPLVQELVAAQKKFSAIACGIDECGDDILCVVAVSVELFKILAQLPATIRNGVEPVRPDIEKLFTTVKIV